MHTDPSTFPLRPPPASPKTSPQNLPTAKTTALSALPSLKQAAPILAGAIPAAVIPSMAMATEGTNEWLGVDDLRLLAVLFFGHWAILSLYLNWSKGFDEEEVSEGGVCVLCMWCVCVCVCCGQLLFDCVAFACVRACLCVEPHASPCVLPS